MRSKTKWLPLSGLIFKCRLFCCLRLFLLFWATSWRSFCQWKVLDLHNMCFNLTQIQGQPSSQFLSWKRLSTTNWTLLYLRRVHGNTIDVKCIDITWISPYTVLTILMSGEVTRVRTIFFVRNTSEDPSHRHSYIITQKKPGFPREYFLTQYFNLTYFVLMVGFNTYMHYAVWS